MSTRNTGPEASRPGNDGLGDSGPGDSGPGNDGFGDSGSGDSGSGNDGPGDSRPGDNGLGNSAPGNSAPGNSPPGDGVPSTLGELASQAGRWLGRSFTDSGQHTGVVAQDPYDQIAWRDTYAQSAGLRELAEELGGRHGYPLDLLTDAFLAAYKVRPRVRERAEMAPSRLVNHQIITSLTQAPDFAELRRETVGDPYAAAMAVLAQATALREMWEGTRSTQEQAEQAQQAQRDAEATAAAVGEALQQAANGADQAGNGSATAATAAVRRAVGAAEAAEAEALRAVRNATRTLEAATPGIRTVARHAAARSAAAARQETTLLRAWGVAPGELERTPYDERVRLAQLLRGSRLTRWAELIGRFRQMASGERARRVENTTGELVGVTLGNDLTRIVPAELAHLGLPELRAVFAARYAAEELMLYDSQGEQSTGQGAIIACVDTSHSMYEGGPGGVTREAWAKACALALLDQAHRAGRDFVGILFSSADQIRVCRFPADEAAGIARVVDFAETFLGGGTSYQTPLSAASELLAEEFNDTARSRGDIVMITDDECDVTEEWTRGWNEAKRLLGFRVFGVAVGAPRAAEAGSVLDALCDNLRCVEDLTDVHAAADLFRVI